jgi:hypothetical protein
MDGQESIELDTLTGRGKVYFRGYEHHVYSDFNNNQYVNDSTFYCRLYLGYLTENAKKVYFSDGTGQRLLFDFSLSIGDSIDICANDPKCYYPFYVHVDSIDSIFIFDRYRKLFYLNAHSSWPFAQKLVEGIGLEFGLLGRIDLQTFACTADFLKIYYYKNDPAYILHASQFKICPPPPPPDTLPPSVTIYPVPAGDYLYVEVKHDTLYRGSKILLYNSLGQLVLDKNMTENPMRIDMSVFSSGIYLLELINENNKAYYYRIPKAR